MAHEIENAAADDARMVKIEGAARTGKTEAIVQRAVRLVAAGNEPGQIWVEVSSGLAADELRRRLERALDGAGADPRMANRVKVAPVAELCCELLDGEQARKATGIAPRVLTSAERKFLLEDLKTTGMRNRKLRNLLRHFARQWATGKPESAWLAPGEQTEIMDLLVRKLRHIDAVLPEELAFRCAEYLASDAGEGARHRFAYVLADDYQNLTSAEQDVVRYCASEQLLVAGNPDQAVHVGADYPNPEGFASFDRLRHGVSVHVLGTMFGNRDALAAYLALSRAGEAEDAPAAELPSKAESTGSDEESLICVKFNTPDDELNEVTKYLRYLLDDHDISSRTYIVAPNRTWLRAAVKVCRQRGFKIDTAGMPTGIGGDPRELKRARAMIAYTKLALIAAPESAVAWRCWCGLGHALLNSDAWMRLEDYADERRLGIVPALAQAADACAHGEEPFLRAKALAAAWEKGQKIIRDNGKRRGFALLHAVGAEKLPEFADINQLMTGDETAAELFALAYRELTSPRFSHEEQALRFITLEGLCGLEADNLVVLGCVNGFIPPRDAFEIVSTDEDRSYLMDSSRRAFASALAKAKRQAILSFFSKANLELAEKTKMQVSRVRSENGTRMALLGPSCFIGEMADAAPGTIGGQQFMAEYGLD